MKRFAWLPASHCPLCVFLLFVALGAWPVAATGAPSSTPDEQVWVTNGPVYVTAIGLDVTTYIGGGFTYFGPDTGSGAVDTIRPVSDDDAPTGWQNEDVTVTLTAIDRGDGTFGAKTDYATGSTPLGVAVADFNGDGKQDLVTANGRGDTASVLLGGGSGGFGPKTDFATGTLPESVAVGDFNGDGKQDLVTANGDADTVSVLLGNGSGGFWAKTDFATGSAPHSVAIGDFNGDGRQDLATSNISDGTVSVLLGTSSGTFAAHADYATGFEPHHVAVGDFNADGKQDLAVSNRLSTTVSVLLGTGSGSFAAATDFTAGVQPRDVVVADFDGDGKEDLAVCDVDADTVGVLLGTGSGSFAAKVDYATGALPVGAACADFDGDGRQDLVTSNYRANTVSVLLGTGSGAFAARTDYATGTTPYRVAVGDFNGDGAKDLVTANWGADTVSVLLGTGASGVDYIEYRGALGVWHQASQIDVPAPPDGSNDGVHHFGYRAVDKAGNIEDENTCRVRIDTRKPTTKAPSRASVRRGRRATLKYKVVDLAPNGGTANVKIRIKTLGGKTVKTLRFSNKPVNITLAAEFRCRLAKKTYRFYVYATDAAGNAQATVGRNRLIVK